MNKAAKNSRGKRSRKARRLEPADVLQARMEYYSGLADEEKKLGAEGSRAKIDEYLRLAQDAAKELGPYRHGRAQTGNDGEQQKQHIIRLPAGHPFKNKEDWLLWSKAATLMEEDARVRAGFETATETLLHRWFAERDKPADDKTALN